MYYEIMSVIHMRLLYFLGQSMCTFVVYTLYLIIIFSVELYE